MTRIPRGTPLPSLRDRPSLIALSGPEGGLGIAPATEVLHRQADAAHLEGFGQQRHAALAEELVFRGYPLRRLSDAIGALPATLATPAAANCTGSSSVHCCVNSPKESPQRGIATT